MGRNYWMIVESPEDFAITKELGITLHGLGPKFRRRAERMQPDDRMLFYVTGIRKWTAIANIASRYFVDHNPIWSPNRRGDTYPYRVKLSPAIVLEEKDYIDALFLAPRLEYVKRWPPEDWPLAFHDRLHLIPQRDFRLIEGEMKRVTKRLKGSRRRRGGRDGSGRGQFGRPPVDQPSLDIEPAAQPLSEGTPVEQSPPDQSPVNQPVGQPPLDDQPAAQPPSEGTPVEQSPPDQSPVNQPVGQPTFYDEPAAQPPSEGTPVEQSPPDQSPVNQPVGRPPLDDQPAEQSPTDQSPINQPVGQPPLGDEPAGQPPSEGTPAEQSRTDQSPVDEAHEPSEP